MTEGGKWMEMKKGKLKDWTSGRLPFTQHFLISITTPFTLSFFFLFFLIKHTPLPHTTHTQKKTVRVHTNTYTEEQLHSNSVTDYLSAPPSAPEWITLRSSSAVTHTHARTREGIEKKKIHTHIKKKGAGGVRGAPKQTPQTKIETAHDDDHISHIISSSCVIYSWVEFTI